MRSELSARRELLLLGLNAWRDAAAATNDLVKENFTRLEHAAPAQRAFLGWELVTTAVELAEIVGSVLLSLRDSRSTPFHTADNDALKDLFAGLRANAIGGAEARSLLRLRIPAGFGRGAIRVARVQPKLVEAIQRVIQYSAQFWSAHLESARWWRHLPMSLTWDESLVAAPSTPEAIAALREDIARTPELIDAFAHLDEKNRRVRHQGLVISDVRNARRLAAAASEFTINIVVNMTPAVVNCPDELWLFPVLTAGLTDAEKQVLIDDGLYKLA